MQADGKSSGAAGASKGASPERFANQYGELLSSVDLQRLRRVISLPDDYGLGSQGLALRVAHREG